MHNMKSTWPNKIVMPIFEFLKEFYDSYVIFQGVDYFEIEHKMC